MHSGYSMLFDAFDGKGEWSFESDYTRNDIIFRVDNSSLSHADNLKNNLVLGEGDTFGINGSFGASEKKFSIKFSKKRHKILLEFTL